MPRGDKWSDRYAGPVVRPYALTGGRTAPARGEVLDLIAIVATTEPAERENDSIDLTPEDRRILGLCLKPVTVTDIASATALPLGVIRVLLADLIARDRIGVLQQRPPGGQPSADLLKEVLHGLRTL
ncbi:MAG TPA: DUF742 domain-containing protein [Streptosporangiaceae bacterium]|nr:DUF742 domain-containing protein [Streptosporangiaceae bacterium]